MAAANSRTVVALTSGGGIDMRRWLSRVPAVIQLWYPGQEGGQALAEILFGERSPEGKLPVTFDRSWEENPVHDTYYPPTHPDGAVAHVKYAEGLFLGYRYYTSREKEPLFPFGFGLSYTTFSFSNLRRARGTVGEHRLVPSVGPVDVSFDVTNTGSRAAAEVVQLYVGDPSAKVARPVRELKGFRKVRLDPGQTQRVTLTLDWRDFAYFDVVERKWRVDCGEFVLAVGDSSENTPLIAKFRYFGNLSTMRELEIP